MLSELSDRSVTVTGVPSAGRVPAGAAGEVDDGELRVGGERAGDRGVLPHAPVARHRALRAAGAGDRAPQRRLAAPRRARRRRLPAPPARH